MNDNYKPGFSCAIIQKDKVILEECFGHIDSQRNNKIDPDTNFNLASLSKQFTALAVLFLIQEGLLKEDDSIRKFLPELPLSFANIKVKHLVHHSSGLREYFDIKLGKENISNALIINYISKNEFLTFNPGEKYQYSNTGYVLLSEIVARVSESSFPKFLEETFFNKLHMNRTYVFSDENISNDHFRAIGHTEGPEFKYCDKSPFNYNYGDGSVCSSLRDMEKWITFLNSPELIFKKEYSEKIFVSGLDNQGKLLGYGYGFGIDTFKNQLAYVHSGSWMGFRSFILNFPDENKWLILFANYAHPNITELALKYL